MSSITDGAAAVAKIIEAVAKAEPTAAAIAGMFVPGAAPIVAMVQPWAPMALDFLDRAMIDISQNNGGDAMKAFLELLQHATKGAPNSPTLSSVTPVLADESARSSA